MKKALVSLLSVALAVSAMSPIVSAEGPENSEATVNFTVPEEKVVPVDPETFEPIEGGEGLQNGPLSLDYVSNLQFGSHKISNKVEEYKSETLRPYIQVSDLRGTGAGWNVEAEISPFTDESGSESLQGFSIKLNNGNASTSLEADESIKAPTVNDEIILEVNKTANVVTADPKNVGESVNTAQGLGTWVARWLATDDENENVTLKVPAGSASAGKHTATITWTLNPGSPDGTEE